MAGRPSGDEPRGVQRGGREGPVPKHPNHELWVGERVRAQGRLGTDKELRDKPWGMQQGLGFLPKPLKDTTRVMLRDLRYAP